MLRDTLLARLQSGLDHLDILLEHSKQEHLIDYLLLMDKWNKTYNLTAIRDVEEMVSKHLLDSISILPFLQGQRFADVGTGAGLPGMVMAIVRPDTQWVLIDSNSKKTRFLQQVVIELKLDNVKVITSRAEDVLDEAGFDLVTSRAVAELKDLVSCSQHLSHQLLAMKGHIPDDELKALPEKVQAEIRLLSVPGLDAERCIILLTG